MNDKDLLLDMHSFLPEKMIVLSHLGHKQFQLTRVGECPDYSPLKWAEINLSENCYSTHLDEVKRTIAKQKMCLNYMEKLFEPKIVFD